MKGVNKETLPVYWASNKKAWMLSSLFIEWFENHFLKQVEAYCKRKKIPFKVLLLVDNCTAHPDISNIHPNVQMMYLPANTTALIQPMDQGIISTVKAYYKKITFSKGQLISEAIFLGFKSPKKQTKRFEGYLPYPLKWVKSNLFFFWRFEAIKNCF